MAEADHDPASSPTPDAAGPEPAPDKTLDARAAAERRFREQVEPLKQGELLSERYRIEREIGRGGMGAVYEAVHVVTDKRVALKSLFPSGSRNAELRARFVREAKAAGRAKHPNIVDVYDIGEHEQGVYMVMELLEGV
jgi:serine/threonine-protein kinase